MLSCTTQKSSASKSVDIRTTSACRTLSRFAFDGIPATYVDEGAEMLYELADEFASLGRSDIAEQIEFIISLTYLDSAGQIEAKGELMNAASFYC